MLTHFITSFMEWRPALTYRVPALTYGAPAISNMDGYGANQRNENAYLSAFDPNSFPAVQNVMSALTYRAPALTYGTPATLDLPPAVITHAVYWSNSIFVKIIKQFVSGDDYLGISYIA